LKVVVKQVWARDCGLKKQCAEGFGDFGFWIVDSVDCGLEKHRAKGMGHSVERSQRRGLSKGLGSWTDTRHQAPLNKKGSARDVPILFLGI